MLLYCISFHIYNYLQRGSKCPQAFGTIPYFNHYFLLRRCQTSSSRPRSCLDDLSCRGNRCQNCPTLFLISSIGQLEHASIIKLFAQLHLPISILGQVQRLLLILIIDEAILVDYRLLSGQPVRYAVDPVEVKPPANEVCG